MGALDAVVAAVTMHECPRCEATAFHLGQGALSRTTRGEGAPVEVCSRCGEREALYGRNPDDQIQLTDWPVSIDRLVEEERSLLTFRRAGEFMTARSINEIVGETS